MFEIILHLSNLLMVVAFLVRSILPLRLLAIAGGLTGIIYDWHIGEMGMVAWEGLFTLVNVVQGGVLIYEKQRAKLTAEEKILHQTQFSKLNVVDFYRLIRIGKWVTSGAGDILTIQGKPVEKIMLLTDGASSVEIDGRIAAYCKQGDFVGEMAFVSGNPASATVQTVVPSRYLMWNFNDLKHLLKKYPELTSALQGVFTSNLVDKLLRDQTTNNVSAG